MTNLPSWKLNELRSTTLENSMKIIEKKVKSLENKKRLLTGKIKTEKFNQIMKELELLVKDTNKLMASVQLHFCENTQNQKAVAAVSRVENFLTKIGNRLLFIDLWFKELPAAKARELIKGSGAYSYHFKTLYKNKKYTLSEKEERILNIKSVTSRSALQSIYDIFTSSFMYDFDGKKLTQEEIRVYVKSTSGKVREKAYRSMLSPYKIHVNVLGEVYKNIVNDWREVGVGLRGYRSPINMRNEYNDVPDKAVTALLSVVSRNQKVFQRFFEIKRKKLGLKRLRRFDLYAPLKKEKGAISWDDGKKMALETFKGFSSKFYEGAKEILDNNHVDARVQKGKRGGAFCYTVTTDLAPYVLLNYTGKFRDVSTLTHELGHGIHSILARGQTEFTQHACLPLAETASIFSEMLLSERMLKVNPKAGKEMMFAKLDDLYASIGRQAGFVQFEITAHEMMREGKTIGEISDEYLKQLRRQLGSKVEVDEIYKYEWAYIPHIFHSPFYCYAYAFGNLLTLALYEMYRDEGKPFVAKMEKMLSLGGSMEPVKIARVVGADICSEAFWQKGFDAIKSMVDKVERM